MRSSVLLAALFGAVANAQTQWEVRADFSRCSNAGSTYEAALDGVNGTTLGGSNIYDFVNITAPFSGALVLKPVGSIGNGSPYPVDQVYIELYETADATGAFGNATFEPGLEVLPLSLVAWYSTEGLNAFSKAKLDASTGLAGDKAVSVKVTVDKSRLRVYYCSIPTYA